MLLQHERELVVAYGKKLIEAGLTQGTGGNVSVLNRELGLFALSPSGMDYFAIAPEQVAVLALDGRVVDAPCKPSTELELHRALYNQKPEVGGVVHAHSPYATALSCMRRELPPLHYLVALAGRRVLCAPYATFGTPELAEAVTSVMGDCRAALMANHGMIAAAETLAAAFKIAEEIEFCARLYCTVLSTGAQPVLLPDEEMERHFALFRTYGQPAGGRGST
ncbi:MAG: L-fuculose-phosphate aldolase [Clostridiales bacterium]|nr:L-fuculose-phosphate aldolase [Clostridiales bacterium]